MYTNVSTMKLSDQAKEAPRRKPYKPAKMNFEAVSDVARNIADSERKDLSDAHPTASIRALNLSTLLMSAALGQDGIADTLGWFFAQTRLKIANLLPEGVTLGPLKLWIVGGRTIEGGKELHPDTDFDFILSFEGDDSWKRSLDVEKCKIVDSQCKDLVEKLNKRFSKKGKHMVDVLGFSHMLSSLEVKQLQERKSRPAFLFASENV